MTNTNWLRSITLALLITGATLSTAQAKEPWQGTMTKETQVGTDHKSIFMDLPMPLDGKILTLERIGIVYQGKVSPYSKVDWCEVRASQPQLPNGGVWYEGLTRILLPALAKVPTLPTYTYALFQTPIHLYAEYKPWATLRVTCHGELIQVQDFFSVTFVGSKE